MVDEVFEYYQSHQALFLVHFNLKEELLEFYKEDILGDDLSNLRAILNKKNQGLLELTDDYENLVDRIIQEENEIKSLIIDTQYELDSINIYLSKFNKLVGFNLITINKSQINLLNKVHFSIKDNPRPTEKWFENSQKDTIRKLIRDNKEFFNEYNTEYEKFKGQYNPDLLSEDIDGILNRFINNYSSIFRIIKSSYKRDRNLLKSYQNQKLQQKNDEIIKSLRSMIKIKKMKQEINQKENFLKDFFGSHYDGEKTNWDSITNYTEAIFDLNGTLQNTGTREKYKDFILQLTTDGNREFSTIKNEIEKSYLKVTDNINTIIRSFVLKLGEINEESNILEYHFSKITTPFMDVIEAKKLVLSYYKGQSFLNTEQWVKLVNLIEDIKQKESEIVNLKDTFTNFYGDLYKGYETDWDLIEKAILWTTEAKNKFKGNIPPWFLRVITDPDKEVHFRNSIDKIEIQKSAIAESLNFYQEVFPLNEPKYYGNSIMEGDISNVAKLIHLMSQQTDLLGEWTELNKMLVRANDLGLSGFLDKGKQLAYDFPFKETFQKRFYKLWLDYAYSVQPALKDFNTNTHNSNISEYKDLDLRLIDVNSSRINEKLYSNKANYIDSLSFRSSEISILKREIQKQKRHKPIRKLFSEIPGLLMALKPCMMMSPLSVSQFIDPSFLKFDLIIFDEASQIRPEDSIGSLFRGKQIVIAGDDKQLPPTAFFSNNVEIEDEFLSEEEEELYENFESILDECLLFMPQMSLKWHYRSKQESLIAFSNREIYNNELYTFPNAINQEHDGVSLIHVTNAVYDRGKSKRNLIEAQKVAELVFEHIKRSPDRSLGIIAFSEAQQEAIRDKIDELREKYPECESFFNEDLFESFFVKNLENVQGDERDTIILSVGYGKDENGVLYYNFGPLNKDGGERRLNVAITRARKELKVVSSILDTDMDDSKLNKRGPRLLKSYLAFAKSRGEFFLNTTVDDADFDSPFEEDVYNMLQRKGLELMKQVGCSGYRIDLAVVDPKNPGKYIMGIECDGAAYHSSKTARDRDRLRQSVLESLGWNIQRIWSQDWVKRKKEITEDIVNQVNFMISESVY
ncbi:AAA domain-containing protein [Bacillus sp. FJAT-49736]|uniref:AAA domain-containing protein n=1 Tax=Bacillus sp. FJAT-49736 TaxID=2833582 RepID=UPI001BCA1143|nr:AAA domain-containing protein [Bacillus sp. FJAT-49736]MBS4173521.1 DUF559 domain-containing protein [Bacillus sp. FJAT-49736]